LASLVRTLAYVCEVVLASPRFGNVQPAPLSKYSLAICPAGPMLVVLRLF
jgi:hypothetical protein